MRMWMINPELLCDQHLLGAHGEIHKFKHSFEKKHNMIKRITLGQIEPKAMKEEHDRLVLEMEKRGMKHNSPYELPDLNYIPQEYLDMKVDADKSIEDLKDRCFKCEEKINTNPINMFKKLFNQTLESGIFYRTPVIEREIK